MISWIAILAAASVAAESSPPRQAAEPNPLLPSPTFPGHPVRLETKTGYCLPDSRVEIDRGHIAVNGTAYVNDLTVTPIRCDEHLMGYWPGNFPTVVMRFSLRGNAQETIWGQSGTKSVSIGGVRDSYVADKDRSLGEKAAGHCTTSFDDGWNQLVRCEAWRTVAQGNWHLILTFVAPPPD